MSKKRGRLDHPGVEALFPDFQIRAARQRHFHAHEYFVICNARNIHAFDLHVFPSVQDGRVHVSVSLSSHWCVITTFSVPSSGLAANSSASAMRSSGNRCEINSRIGKRRSNTSAADSS